MIDMTEVIVALIGLLGIVITTVAIPLIKSKTTAAQWANIVAWASTAVQAAEVIYKGTGRGEEKRDYVLDWVKKQAAARGIRVDTDTIRAALEEAWRTMAEVGK